MDARTALSTINDQLDDLQSFAETFDPEFWGGEPDGDEGFDREELQRTGRFGDEVVAEGDQALKALVAVLDAVKDVVDLFSNGSGSIDDQHLAAIDRLTVLYRAGASS